MSLGSGLGERKDRARHGGSRHSVFASYLSSEEKRALGGLEDDTPRRKVPVPQALRLLSLGLAELSGGRLVLTRRGRDALDTVREPSRGSGR